MFLLTFVPDVTTIAVNVSPVFNDMLWPPHNPRGTDNDEMLMICVLQGLFGSGPNACISSGFFASRISLC